MNRLRGFFENIKASAKASAEKIKASAEGAGRMVQGLDSNESLYYGGYTLKVGQEFEMLREIIPTGTYQSPGKIIGFKENGRIVVIERYSISEGRYIFKAYSIEEFVRKINRGEVIGIPDDPNLVVKSYGGYTFEVGQTFKIKRVIPEERHILLPRKNNRI